MPKFNQNRRICVTSLFFFIFVMGISVCGCMGAREDSFQFQMEENGREPDSMEISSVSPADIGQDISSSFQNEESREPDPAACCVVVHICGAVNHPGVYELPEGSRVVDAVRAGGGFLPEADQAACNLAAPVLDGCRIYIVTLEESSLAAGERREAGIYVENPGQAATEGGGRDAGDGKVNLNTADASALKTLPGIGDSRAAAIIAWREEHGQFKSTEDIMKVSGIKQAAFLKIKDKIKV